MANYIYIATSLDGYIASEDGGIDWLNEFPNSTNSDYGFGEFMERVDGLVMGRKTYEKVLSFGQWPYTKKVFVLSNKLKEIPEELSDKVEIINGEINEVVTTLHNRAYKNLYIDGGKTIQSFLELGLIDEMIITRIPILLGGGIPLFAKLDKAIKFDQVKTEVLDDFLVKSTYIINKK